MTKQDYRNSITAPVSATEAYDKIARVSEWWGKDFEGSTRYVGDKYTIRFGETWVEFKITEAVPDKKLVWHVVDSCLPWLNDKTEWNDTSVIFELSSDNGHTTVTMTHEGLAPEVECYSNCQKGWNFYIGESLYAFLTTGSGKPNSRV
jgi:Activator of Hsp90 ATPase homolog 1-like protein